MVKVRFKVRDRLKTNISKTTFYHCIWTCNLWHQGWMLMFLMPEGLQRTSTSNMQPLVPEADAYAHPQSPSQTETYLKVTSLTVAPSGLFPRHLLLSSYKDGRRILTFITGDLTDFEPLPVKCRTYVSWAEIKGPRNVPHSQKTHLSQIYCPKNVFISLLVSIYHLQR